MEGISISHLEGGIRDKAVLPDKEERRQLVHRHRSVLRKERKKGRGRESVQQKLKRGITSGKQTKAESHTHQSCSPARLSWRERSK